MIASLNAEQILGPSWVRVSPNVVATINTVTSRLLLSSLSMCLIFSQNDFTQGSEFLHAHLYWPKKIKNAKFIGF